MTIKKSILAVGTAGVVAFAGTGIASAANDEDLPDTTLSADGSFENVDLSEQAGDVFGSVDETTGDWDLGLGIGGLDNFVTATGLIVGSIAILPGLYYGIKDFQTFVDDATADIQALLP